MQFRVPGVEEEPLRYDDDEAQGRKAGTLSEIQELWNVAVFNNLCISGFKDIET